MVLMIPEEVSFTLSAYATSPRYQFLVLRGYLVERRNGETWIAAGLVFLGIVILPMVVRDILISCQ